MADKGTFDWDNIKNYVLAGFFVIGGILILRAVDIIDVAVNFHI